jgi:hypothetical protein
VGAIWRAIMVDVMRCIAKSRDDRCITVRSNDGKRNERFNDSVIIVGIMWCIALGKNDRLL